MAVSDQWHRAPRPGDEPCECGTARKPLCPSSRHKQGDRWQVRWRDPATGKQRKRNFARRVGQNPDEHADAFDAQVQRDVDTGNYVDPQLREGTFGAYAEQWLASRSHDDSTAVTVRARLYWHVLEDPGNPGRTRRGGPALGHLTWAQLQRYPSLTQAWIAGLACAASTAGRVVSVVSSVVSSAMDDGLIGRDPTKARSVTRPLASVPRAAAWDAETVAAVERELPPRYRIAMRAGPCTGARQSEVFALAETDVSWLARPGERVITIAVQLKRVGGRPCYAPLKNRRAHQVPVPDELVDQLAAHLRQFPAAEVTLPWHDRQDRERHGQMVTRRLVVSDGSGAPLRSSTWNRDAWKPALSRAGLIGDRKRGGTRTWPAARDKGTHAAWRHTAVSQWLSRGVEITAVAEWIGDTVATVWRTYAHMVPGAEGRGRTATSAFLAELDAAACAPDVPRDADSGTS